MENWFHPFAALLCCWQSCTYHKRQDYCTTQALHRLCIGKLKLHIQHIDALFFVPNIVILCSNLNKNKYIVQLREKRFYMNFKPQ